MRNKNQRFFISRKYTPRKLLQHVLLILKSGVSYRCYNDISRYNDKMPHWNTIYKFLNKLIKYNVIKNTFKDTVKHYMNNSKNNIFITDTTLIANKCGIDCINYNPQLLKHKSTKISLITDIKGTPINVNIFSSNMNDSKILNLQLDNISSYKEDNNNILLGDAGYDSNIIRDKLHRMRFGQLITPRNKRNCKNNIKLNALKLSQPSKEKLKHRIKVEHVFAHIKAYKRINI